MSTPNIAAVIQASSPRTLLLGVTLLGLLFAGCDDGTPRVEAPAAVETCDGLVDVGEQLVRAYVQVLDQTDVGDLLAGAEDPNLAELAAIGAELDVRASGLGCDVAELNSAIVTSTADLEATSPPVEMFLSVVREGPVGSLGAPPATSP